MVKSCVTEGIKFSLPPAAPIFVSLINMLPGIINNDGFMIGDIMTGAACGVGNVYPSGAPEFTSGFHRGSCCPVICVSLFHVIVIKFLALIVPFV